MISLIASLTTEHIYI